MDVIETLKQNPDFLRLGVVTMEDRKLFWALMEMFKITAMKAELGESLSIQSFRRMTKLLYKEID
jgi:hypothetical protein